MSRWTSVVGKGYRQGRAGVNNIPLDKCFRSGFQYPGTMPMGKELVIAGLLLSSEIVHGIGGQGLVGQDQVQAYEKSDCRS